MVNFSTVVLTSGLTITHIAQGSGCMHSHVLSPTHFSSSACQGTLGLYRSSTNYSSDNMFAKDQLFSTERWILLFMLDLGVRYTLLVIYLVLSDNSFSKELEPVDLTLTTLEMLGMFTSVVLINDTFILVLVMKIVAVLEVLKFLICVALAVHLALSFNSLAKLCLAIFLLSVCSVSGGFKCWYGYHIISPPREPILSNPRGNDTTIHMDSYNENQGPLSVAYQCQKEQRQEWNYHRVSEDQVSCSEEDQLFEQVSPQYAQSTVIEVSI